MRRQFTLSSHKTDFARALEEALMEAVEALHPGRRGKTDGPEMTAEQVTQAMSPACTGALIMADLAIRALVVMERTQALIRDKNNLIIQYRHHKTPLDPEDIGYIPLKNRMYADVRESKQPAELQAAEAFWAIAHLCLNHHAKTVTEEYRTEKTGTLMSEAYFIGARMQTAYFVMNAAGCLLKEGQKGASERLFKVSKDLVDSVKQTLLPGPISCLQFLKNFDQDIRHTKDGQKMAEKLDAMIRPFDRSFPGPGNNKLPPAPSA